MTPSYPVITIEVVIAGYVVIVLHSPIYLSLLLWCANIRQEKEIQELRGRRDKLFQRIRYQFTFIYRAEGQAIYNQYAGYPGGGATQDSANLP